MQVEIIKTKSLKTIDRQFSVAPMLDWTDRHCRYFHRQLTRCSLLYTEMITTGALLHGDVDRHLQFNAEEHPVAIQLGGSDPADLATASTLVESWGYDEINLNVGCPSDRVQNGAFGACLMAEPRLVADCIKAMQESVSIPVTIKHRIGIDEQDSYEELVNFIGTVAESGCKTFIIHARKAWLKGLSPKQNREIPPLSYESVYRIKKEFPALEVVINGGIMNLEESRAHLQHVDGVMIGRAAYHTPWMLSQVDSTLYGQQDPCSSPREAVEAMIPYVEKHLADGGKLSHVTRHMLGLFSGMPGARRWRRILSENANQPSADSALLLTAMNEVSID